ncbi:MAG: protein kinase [Elusimicrobia bacterium]|nr:protein kinase [Elusimicrobiota bacterium]
MSGRRRLPAALLLAGFLLAQGSASWAQKVTLAQLRQRADQNDSEAQYWLCYRYWKGGDGAEPDYKAALGYCQKSSQAGHPKATTVLGCMYRRGQGVAKDYRQALRLLSSGANAGMARADYELGLMYKKGEAVLPDAAQADMHFCHAVRLGECLARQECSETRSKMGGFQMGGFTQGLSSSGGFAGLKNRNMQGGDSCAEDMLRPELGGVVMPPGGIGADQAPPGLPPINQDQVRQTVQNFVLQMTPVPGDPKAAAARPPPAANEPDVSLNKAVSLQGNPPPQSPGPAAKAPEPSAVPIPVAAPAAPNAEPRPPQKPSQLPVIVLIAAGLVFSLVGIIAYFAYKASLLSSRQRAPVRIRELLGAEAPPQQEIADLYHTYCKQGGQAEAFTSGELQAIVACLDSVGRDFPTPGLSCAKALELAGKLAAAGKTARMQDVLSEPMLVQAATAGRADEVLVLLAKSKSVDDFANHFSAPGRPSDFYGAYASGLARLGRTEQALKMLTVKPMERFSPEDQTLLLELHVKLGHFDQAGLLLDQVTQHKPPAEAKDYYEELAKQATMHGGERLADDLRTIAAGKPLQGAPARPPATAGKVLAGKYELRSLISSGGMGEVYDGYDRSLDRHVAIKRLLPGLLVDPLMREQFLREAKTAAHLTHPYIVPIYESLVSGDDLYLVFEFVKGETLHSVLSRRSRLSLKECQGLFHYVCHALDYAHRKHVLHRDLKPANIMLDENGIARVMDFGIAVEATGTLSATFVDKGGVTGTLRYMPPEQHYGKATRASDIYALGICLYEMATGYLPFNAPSVQELVEQKHKGEFHPPSFHVHELPKEFDALIRQALAPDPKSRMQNVLELYEQLAKIPT